jgi:hypothetical protein
MSEVTGDDDWTDGIPDRQRHYSATSENSWQNLDDANSSYDPNFVGKCK